METVWEILPFVEHQALFFSERYGCAIHRFAFLVQNYGYKSTLGKDAPQTTTATIGNMLPQDLKTNVFRKKRCYFAAVIQMNRCLLRYLNYCLLDYVEVHLDSKIE